VHLAWRRKEQARKIRRRRCNRGGEEEEEEEEGGTGRGEGEGEGEGEVPMSTPMSGRPRTTEEAISRAKRTTTMAAKGRPMREMKLTLFVRADSFVLSSSSYQY